MIIKLLRRKKFLVTICAGFLAVLVACSCSGSLQISNGDLSMRTPDGITGNLEVSDMPLTHSPVFTGNTTNTTYLASFSTSTGPYSITLTNGFKNDTRSDVFGLTNSTFARPGWDMYKAQVQLINNKTTAVNDWVNVLSTDLGSSNKQILESSSAGNTYIEALAQPITQKWRVQITNVTTRIRVASTNPSQIPAPKMQLWNDSGGSGPSKYLYSQDMTKSTAGIVWYSLSTNYIINASAPANRTWYVVINGTQWGNAPQSDPSDYIWWCGLGIGGYHIYWTGGGWGNDPHKFCLAYERLFLNDSTSANRTLKASEINLRVNGTSFNNTGYATISGSNIRALNFSSDTTCATFKVSLKLFYRKILPAYRTYWSDGSANIKWNITSETPVDYPKGAKADVKLNLTKPASWTVPGSNAVYNASSFSGLASAPAYPTYTVIGNDVIISGIVLNSTWQVRCTSVNQVTSIVNRVNGAIVITNIERSSSVNFTVNLAGSQSTGNMSIGVYTPTNGTGSRVFWTNKTLTASTSTITFPLNWSTLGVLFGVYRVQARWNSTIDVGFKEELLNVWDWIPPTTTISYTPAYGSNFVNSSTLFTLAATDDTGGSDVASTQYNYTGHGGLLPYTVGSPFHLTSATNGTITINYHSTDNAGNVEVFETLIVRLDTNPPTTTLSFTPAHSTNFVNTTTQFKLVAVDGGVLESGVKATYYRLGTTGPWTIYLGIFTVGAMPNGTITIQYGSIDNVGNNESIPTIKSTVVRLDKNPPITTLSYTPAYGSNFVNTTTQFKLVAVDGGVLESGVKATYYRLGTTGPWTIYLGIFTVGAMPNGTITIQYGSFDNVGNNESIPTIKSIMVRLDKIAPTTTMSPSSSPVTIAITTAFTFTVNDFGGSGVAFTNITIKGPSPAITTRSWLYLPGNDTFTFLDRNVMNAGQYNVSWFSTDHIGNKEAVHFLIAILNRTTSISIVSLAQPEYSYSSTNYTVYFGKNATASLSFKNDLGQNITNATLLDINVNGQHFITSTPAGGLYIIVMHISNFPAGNYSMTIIANKTGLNNATVQTMLSILPVPVTITVLHRLQTINELQPNPSSGVYVGNSVQNLTIIVAVNNSLDNSPITFGTLNMLYIWGTKVEFNASVSDIDDGVADGLYTIVLPGNKQLTDTDASLLFQWTSTSPNYANKTASAEFKIRFTSIFNNINWLEVAIVLIFLFMVPVIYNAVLRRIVIPRKLERHNLLAKISSAFEDAANIQNVLIIHKASGTCLFFKSYGKSSLDPDLITGFLTAIQSFGMEMSGNKSLEELTWQDYQLLLGEGALSRVALVLASKASGILKGLMPQFVARYESLYKDKLANWRGDLTSFRDSIKVINEVFDTAIILPHKRSDMPITPRSSLAKKILEVASTLTKDRDYFFIATLLSESITKTKQSYAEIIAAIQELRKDNILVPIDIESIEKKKEITQEEVINLQQRVSQIPFLNPDEKAKLIQDLQKMSAEEREATLGSMTVMSQLQSATTQSIRGSEAGAAPSKQAGTITSQVPANLAGIKNKNEAMNRIKNLDKSARVCLKNYEYEGAIKLYEESESIAAQWNLKNMITQITHKKIDASVRDIQYKQTVLLTEASSAEKHGDKATAIQKYTEAANFSSSLFKLGVSTEDKKMREYIKKAEGLKKQSTS